MATADIIKIEYPRIEFKTLKDIKDFALIYHKREDTLFIRPSDKPCPATSIDWNGELWIRVDMETGRIVGLEINDFESIFLKKHPELSKAWEIVKPSCCRGRFRSRNCGENKESFFNILINFLNSIFKTNPQSLSFA